MAENKVMEWRFAMSVVQLGRVFCHRRRGRPACSPC